MASRKIPQHGVGSSATTPVSTGGSRAPTPPSRPMPAPTRQATKTPGVVKTSAMMKSGGMAKMKKDEMPSKMGKVKTSPKADGVATKGKTKGKMVKMAAGGMKGYKKGGMSC